MAWTRSGPGYSPQPPAPSPQPYELAGVRLLALTLLGTAAFDAGSPTAVKRGEGAPFQPLVHTLDLLIPIGGLGQRTAWYWRDGTLQWLAYALIAVGWILTTAVIAGVTRTLQKN